MTNRDPALDGITIVDYKVPDSLKHFLRAPSSSIAISAARIANDMASMTAAASHISATPFKSASLSAPTYTVTSVPFNLEAAPANFLMSCDDCVAYDTPLGFDFTFFGNTYNKVHVGANGFVGFDRSIGEGCCEGGVIPFGGDAPYNNLIAIAWTDLNSGALNADIRYETQGTAPNRKFVLQYNNVPEYFMGPGFVTAQLVLSEGSNDITINTLSENISGQYHAVTQGIENADGTEAEFVPGRVQSFFTLTRDAVKFSLGGAPVLDVDPPVITVPAPMTVNATSPAGALVNYSVSFTDNVGVTEHSCVPASGTTLAIGSTSVTCNASDAAGNTAAPKTFTVTVVGFQDQAEGLIAYIRRQNLPNGTTNPLVNQVRAALIASNNSVSCTKMNDFLHMVAVKHGSLSYPQSSYMIGEATRMMGVMGCS